MDDKELIKVFIDFENGKTVCICKRSRRGCGKNCHPDVVERDKFRGWQETFKQNRYGRSRGNEE